MADKSNGRVGYRGYVKFEEKCEQLCIYKVTCRKTLIVFYE